MAGRTPTASNGDVEDRTQLDDKRGLWEPWGFAVAMRLPDGSITNRDGHEFWIPSTRFHRINYYDHWTAHSLGRSKAHFPPLWYIQADGLTGKTTACRFIGTPGTPTDYATSRGSARCASRTACCTGPTSWATASTVAA